MKSRSKSFENLQNKIKTKGAQNNYFTLQIEDYLTSKSVLNWNEKLTAFKIRTGMLKIASNFRGRFGNEDKCQLGCDKFENLEHILENCDKVEQNVEESLDTDEIEGIYNGTNVERKSLIRKIYKIIEKRNILIDKQS